ncbi:ABC transporter substrate-binding protein [uncultured Agrococcus sp.]|uniref:ABC transporter substrate-binding protein n=1 Tax=uncultured Agrococcus sp. TaxID=382258 RepID=UPI0025EABB04|nr:ABC transporter substrate-binding protein [uncultured Agrococcus sp.]
MKKPIRLLVASAMTIALTSCAADAPDTEPVDGGTFTMAIGSDPGALDPAFTTAGVTHQVQQFVYDSLLYVDANGDLVAGLAEDWDGTNTEATFTLRDGITCSDGSPLTASDVEANINFIADPDNQSTRTGLFVPPLATATADDETRTVTVTSDTPDAFLVQNIGSVLIVCGDGLEDRSTLEQGALGTGPFVLEEFVAEDHYTFSRRADYAWGPGEWDTDVVGLPDTVILRIVPNETTAANLLLEGSVNATAISGADQRRMSDNELFERELVNPLGWLWFNQAEGLPGESEDVRRALTQLVNLEELGTALSGDLGRPSESLVVPGLGVCEVNTIDGNLPGHDPEAGMAGLAAAGWESTDSGLMRDGQQMSISLLYPTSYGSSMAAGVELLAAEWREIGVDVTARGVTDVESSQVILGGEGSWDVTFMPIGITQPGQIVPYLDGPTPPDGVNFAAIDNPEYLAAVGEASGLPGAEGCDTWAEAESALVSAVDVVPFVDAVTVFYGSSVEFELFQGSVAPTSIRMLG